MEQYVISIKKNIMCQDSNEMFNYGIKIGRASCRERV